MFAGGRWGGLRLLVPGLVLVLSAAAAAGGQDGFSSGFGDVDGSGVHAPGIGALESEGLLAGTECGEGMFCGGNRC